MGSENGSSKHLLQSFASKDPKSSSIDKLDAVSINQSIVKLPKINKKNRQQFDKNITFSKQPNTVQHVQNKLDTASKKKLDDSSLEREDFSPNNKADAEMMAKRNI